MPDRAHYLNIVETVEWMSKQDHPCCANCLFYLEFDSGPPHPYGLCRRYPPQPQHFGADDFPTTGYNGLCGEHRRGVHPAAQQRRADWRAEYGEKKRG